MAQRIFTWGLLLLIGVTFAGCSASGMKDVTKTGFLGDYSQLKPGGDDRAALFYIKPGINLKPYNKLSAYL